SETVSVDVSSGVARLKRRRALARDATAFGVLSGFLVLIWALTSRGYFWPAWPMIVLALPVAVRAWLVVLDERPHLAGPRWVTRALAIPARVSPAPFPFLLPA